MGVGGKRFRGLGRTDGLNASAPVHDSSLLDDVRASRDVEYAAQQRASKRQRRSSASTREKPQAGKREGSRTAERARHDAEETDANSVAPGSVEEDARILDARTSAKILKTAHEQRQEVRRADLDAIADLAAKDAACSNGKRAWGSGARHRAELIRTGDDDDSEDGDSDHEDPIRENRGVGNSLAVDDEAEFPSLRASTKSRRRANAGALKESSGVLDKLGHGKEDIDLDGSASPAHDEDSDGDGDGDGDPVADDPEYDVRVLDGTALTAADELALSMFAFGDEGNQRGAQEGQSQSVLFGDDTGGGGRVNLGDIIVAKLREKAAEEEAAAARRANPEAAAREQKIAEVYGLVGNILAKYKSGRIPKAFKIIPKMRDWERLMYLTRPDEWSPAALYAATRLFASNLDSREVVMYYRDVLLPRALDDIAVNKKLNYHIYRAIRKAVYKPDAFNKGILFPLCEAGGCSLREASIFGSILTRVSIPMLHSAAALLYIAQQPYALSHSVLIHALLDKKYALPYRVIDALVVHFGRMKTEPATLPLVWHLSLLTFARRYKTEMEVWQKDELKLLMRVQTHDKVTPEIRRELFSARSRGEMVDPDPNTIARAIASAS